MRSFTRTILICFLFVSSLQPFSTMVAAQGAGWLDGWDYRQGFTVSNSSGAGTNYQVYLNVTYNANMQPDFDCLRFTAYDGVTEWDYWIEYKIDSSYADVWVEIADNLNYTQMGYMYYGNDGAGAVSNGDDTFIFFDDFEDNDLLEWTVSTGVSIESSIVHTGAYAAKIESAEKLEKDFGPVTHGIMLHYQGYSVDSFRGISAQIMSESGTNAAIVANQREATTSSIYYYDGAYKTWTGVTDIYDDTTYYEYEIGCDQNYVTPDPDMRLFMEGLYIGEEDFHDSADNDFTTENIGRIRISSFTTYLNYVDDVWLRKWIVQEPVVIWGSWNAVTIAELFLRVVWSPAVQFGYDAFFIFLGLIMIPASTLYLVRGGRKEMSRDKLFYGLIMLGMGLGLLIGGVMP